MFGNRTETTLEAYYSELDEFPLYNWIKCQDGQYLYTRIDKNKGTDEQDMKAFEVLYNEYLKHYGLSETYQDLLEKRMRLAELKVKFIQSCDAFILNDIAEMEHHIQEVQSRLKETHQTTEQTLVHLSKFMRQMINTKDITVTAYMALIEEYGRN